MPCPEGVEAAVAIQAAQAALPKAMSHDFHCSSPVAKPCSRCPSPVYTPTYVYSACLHEFFSRSEALVPLRPCRTLSQRQASLLVNGDPLHAGVHRGPWLRTRQTRCCCAVQAARPSGPATAQYMRTAPAGSRSINPSIHKSTVAGHTAAVQPPVPAGPRCPG